MTRLKNIINESMIGYPFFFGFLAVLICTNQYILSFVAGATETGFNPFCIKEWMWVLLEL